MRKLAALCLFVAACSQGSSAPQPDLSPAPPDLSPPPTDAQRCDAACAKLVGCGVQYGSNCSAGCQNSNVFLTCLKASADDCNAIALCAFKQYSALACNNTGGVPAGTASCNDTANCEAACNAANMPPA